MAPRLLAPPVAMGTLISFRALQTLQASQPEDLAYEARIKAMSKLELLEEMVRFQEERSGIEELSPSMMVRGKTLFRALEQTAETDELRLLARSYRRHLEYELADFLKPPGTPATPDEAAES